MKLDESTTKIWGYYTNLESQLKPIIEVDSTSFNKYVICNAYIFKLFNLEYFQRL